MSFIAYLPPFMREVVEIKAIADTYDIEIINLQDATNLLPSESAITTASEERLKDWEIVLGIIPQDRTILQRRMMILATLQGTGKLNEEKIKTIVRTFTGGGCLAGFANSIITVKISPPEWGEIFLFPDVEKALRPLIPAHLDLEVIRYYNTWKNRKDQYVTWNDLMTGNADWAELRNKVEEI